MDRGGTAQERQQRKKALLDLLRQIRRAPGLRQVELAQRLGKPQSYVSKYESGERRLDLLDLEQVCQAVGITMVSFTKRFERSRAGCSEGSSKESKAPEASS